MSELKINNNVYFKYIIDFTPYQIKKFKVLCKNKHLNLGHTFRLFLTKSQIKDVNKATKNKVKYNLEISNIQLRETCSSVIKLNDKIEKVTPKDINDRNNYIKYLIFLTPS